MLSNGLATVLSVGVAAGAATGVSATVADSRRALARSRAACSSAVSGLVAAVDETWPVSIYSALYESRSKIPVYSFWNIARRGIGPVLIPTMR